MKILKEEKHIDPYTDEVLYDDSVFGQRKDAPKERTKETIEEVIEKRLRDTSKEYTDDQLRNDVEALLKSWGAEK